MLFPALPDSLVSELTAHAESIETFDENLSTFLCCHPGVIYDYEVRKMLDVTAPPQGYTHAEAVATLLSLYENEHCSLYRLPRGAFYFCV